MRLAVLLEWVLAGAMLGVAPAPARAQMIGAGEADAGDGAAGLSREQRHWLHESEAIDHGVTMTLAVDHLQRGDGAGLWLQSPSVELGAGLHLRGDLGYDMLLLPNLVDASGGRTAAGSQLVSGSGELVWHALPNQALLPSLSLGAVGAVANREGVTSHPRAVGERIAAGVEVPLSFGRVAEGPRTETGASLVVQYEWLLGLPKADELPGAPDLYAGGMAVFGLRFYL